MAINTEQDSHFLTTAAEVRNNIYRCLLTIPTPLWIDNDGIDRVHFSDPFHRIHPSILLCCKQTLTEALPILYGENTIMLNAQLPASPFSPLEQVLQSRYINQTKLDLNHHFAINPKYGFTGTFANGLDRFSKLEKVTVVNHFRSILFRQSEDPSWLAVVPSGVSDSVKWIVDHLPAWKMTRELKTLLDRRPAVKLEVVLVKDPYDYAVQSRVSTGLITTRTVQVETAIVFDVAWKEKEGCFALTYVSHETGEEMPWAQMEALRPDQCAPMPRPGYAGAHVWHALHCRG